MNELKKDGVPPSGRPVVFGEVLFDDFEDGPTVIGGAAFNLAWNLESIGLGPLLVSRVGRDELGDRALEIMGSYGMDVSGIQADEELPTGTVSVKVSAGQPEFAINDRQAYDAIDADEARAAVSVIEVSLLYHGSLALRSERSRRALDALAAAGRGRIFVDVNLRRPWWEKASVLGDLSRARWAKLNEEELFELSDVPDSSPEGLLAAASDFRRQLDLDLLLLTRGADGAALLQADPGLAGPSKRRGLIVPLLLALAGLGLVVLGGAALVDGAVALARAFGIGETVIGLTIVAVGTSMPELVTSVIAALKRQGDVAFGNIVGSNMYNILGIGGTTALIAPSAVPAEIVRFDAPLMVGVSVLFVVFAATGRRIARGEGLALLAGYCAYLYMLWP